MQLTLAILIVLLAGCSVQKTSEDIRDTSKEIRDTSKEIRDTSKEISENSRDIRSRSEHLANRTDDVEYELLDGTSFQIFNQMIELLFGGPAANPRSPDAHLNSEPDYLFAAGGVMQSASFQYWKGDYRSDLNALDEAFRHTAEILFDRSVKHVPRDFAVDIWRPNRSYLAIGSMGVMLDKVTPHFEATLREHKVDPVNMYEIVLTALRGRDQETPPGPYPRSYEQILLFRQEAIYMLQLRHNFLPMVLLGRITDLQDRSTAQRLLMFLGVVPKINLRASDFTIVELEKFTRSLKKVTATRQALREMGITPLYNAIYAGILHNMDLGRSELLAAPGDSPLERARYDFAEAYRAVVGESDAGVAVQRQHFYQRWLPDLSGFTTGGL